MTVSAVHERQSAQPDRSTRTESASRSTSAASRSTGRRDTQKPGSSRWFFVVVALAAGLCWAGALSLLFLANLSREVDPFAPQRLLFYGLVLGAGLLTFIPIQEGLQLPGLAVEGVLSSAVLLYTLAFVPPPTDWLLALPDIPVYVLFIGALFWTVSAIVLPFSYVIGQRVFKKRPQQRDLRRARRQAYEVGGLVACVAILAALNVLTWVSLLLVLLILVTAELLFLSLVRVGPEG